MNKLHEKYLRTKKSLKVFFSKFMNKGREHLTIMFVPHSEKKILNLQISNFIISAVVLVLLVIVSFSLISLNTHETEIN